MDGHLSSWNIVVASTDYIEDEVDVRKHHACEHDLGHTGRVGTLENGVEVVIVLLLTSVDAIELFSRRSYCDLRQRSARAWCD